MKHKINWLIALSAIVLVALSAMQYYLVKTAYHYKVEQFRTEVKDKIARITNEYSDIDTHIFNKKDTLYKELAQSYLRDPRVGLRIRNVLLQNAFREELTRKLQHDFRTELPDLQIDFAVVLNKFVMYNDTETADTLYSGRPAIENKMFGNLATLDNAFLVRNYVGTTSGSSAAMPFKLLTEDALYVSVAGSEAIILKRMATILILALLSILTLVTLFVIALRALIRQKKVSDIKTDFINNITHELKTPLTTIAVSTKILQRKEIRDNDAAFDNVLSAISRQNTRLQGLIEQVMTNTLGFDEIGLRKETVDIHNLLQKITGDFALAFPQVQITTDLYAGQPQLKLDKFHLTTALLNVLENAVKYGCSNIIISSSYAEQQFRIGIQDDGIGIDAHKHPLLFDKFYRIQEGNLHTTKGLGLGLYYAAQIIKAHSGHINVDSAIGKGALFTIRIPAL